MGPVERYSVRLTPETVAVLNTFVESGEYNSLNEVIMAAINDFIMSRLGPEDVRRILEEKIDVVPIDPLTVIAQDENAGFDDIIKTAVEKYVREKMEGIR